MPFNPAALAGLWRERLALRWTVLALVLWGISAVLLLPWLGYPRAVVFDETYMIPRAQRYLQGIFFQESHPPLGRLMIALGQILVHPNERPDDFALLEKINESWPQDQDMTGYRLMPALFGTLIPVLVFFILLRILAAEFIAFITSLFLVFDNALLVQSHFALSDSTLIAFSLLSILVFVHLYSQDPGAGRRTWPLWLLWGAAAAAALLVKFSAQFVLYLAPVYVLKLFLDGRKRQILPFAAVFGLAFAFTTAAVWQLHFSLVPKLDPGNNYEISSVHNDILAGDAHPDAITKFYVQLRDALIFISHYHKGVPNLDLTKPGEIGSPWFQWPLGGRAINYRWQTPDGDVFYYIYLFGNPGTWLLSLLGVLGGTGLVISDLLFGFLPAERRRWPYVFVLLYWAYLIPAMFVQRVLYLYHYLPPMIIGIILFGLVIGEASRLSRRARTGILLIALVLVQTGFWVYRPLTSYGPLTNEQFERLAVWPAWDLRCAKCSSGK